MTRGAPSGRRGTGADTFADYPPTFVMCVI